MNRYQPAIPFVVFTAITCVILLALPPAATGSDLEDRMAIQELMSRYLFALDFRNAEAYARTFTEDGILNHGGGLASGRAAIHDMVTDLAARDREAAAAGTTGRRPIPGRHSITNIIINVRGDTATSRSYWTYFGADEQGRARATSYGHYQDELVKQDGQWLFSRRVIFNEFRDGRQYGVLDPD